MTRVLVVDDEPQIVRALQINLRARRYEVHTAVNGTAALTIAAQHPPDLVILDLGLPDFDGVDVIRGIRDWTAAPILVLVVALQLGRRPDGVRVGIAFSSLALLRAASGSRQDWLRMHEDQLRELLARLGISVIQLDPVLVGPDVGASAEELVGSHGH